MNDGMLSQEEIDALLNGTNDEEDTKEDTQSLNNEDFLSPMEQDALGEIGNISFGSSATALSTLLNQKVDITTPHVSIIRKEHLEDEFPKPYVAISVNYTTGFIGSNLLVVNQTDASIIADLMLGGNGLSASNHFNELQLSAVQEAMNQMMGNAATSMSTIFHKRVEISPPTINLLNIREGEGTEALPTDNYLVKVSFRLIVGELINSSIMQLLPVSFAKKLVSDLMNPAMEEATAVVEEIEKNSVNVYEHQNNSADGFHYSEPGLLNSKANANNYNTNSLQQNNYAHAQDQSQYGSPTMSNSTHTNQQKNIQQAVFSDFSPVHSEVQEPRNLQMLYDIPLQVTVELGRTTKLVKDILDLSPGSIIELDKLAGEPVDILVNNKLIAKGEVVVIEENFGVRITDIISQSERIKKMY